MKKAIIIISILLGYLLTISGQNVKIGDSPGAADPSAILELESIDKGFLPTRMTESERDNISNPTIGLLIFQTDGTTGFYYYSGSAWTPVHTGSTPPPPTVAIGDTIYGGIVFWVDPGDNTKGKVCAMTDQSAGAEWGCYNNFVTDADAVDNGLQNTLDILNEGCGPQTHANTVAAYLCAAYRGGGYSDWYLPAKNELNLMWDNLADSDGDNINTGPSDPNNLGGFASNYCWSSTEYGTDDAWDQYFGDGYQHLSNKSSTGYVRAVRAF